MPLECLVCPRLARYGSYGGISNVDTLDACMHPCSALTSTRRLLSSEEDRLPVAERSDSGRSGRAYYAAITY
jgi:hypothetical protein